MKIIIPKSIKFMGHDYSVEFDTKALASAQSGCITHHYYQKIILDNVVNPKSELEQMFLHELIHVIERHMSMKFDDADVDRLAEGLYSILKSNMGIEFDWTNIN